MFRTVLFLLLLIFANKCFGQKNMYLIPEIGFGATFTKQQSIATNSLESELAPSGILGLSFSVQFNKRFSFNTGASIFNYGYESRYTAQIKGQTIRSGRQYRQRFISVPLFLQTNFKVSKKRPYDLTLLTGANLGFKAGDNNEIGGFHFLNETHDSIKGTALFTSNSNLFSLGLLLGTGFEKTTKNNSKWGFKFLVQIGLIESYIGKLETAEHGTYIPYEPEQNVNMATFIISDKNTVPTSSIQNPDKTSIINSTNTSIFLTFYYAFNLRKNKKEQ